MRKSISVMLAAAIIAAGGILAYAMGGHGGMHGGGSSKSGSHMMQHSGHDDESMQHGDTGNHGMEGDWEVSVSEEDAKEIIDTFLSDNFHGFKYGDAALTEGSMVTPPLYRAPVTLADGTEGAIFVDATNGEPVGILLGDYEDVYSGFHHGLGESGHGHMEHTMGHGSEGESEGNSSGEDSDDEGEEAPRHQDH